MSDIVERSRAELGRHFGPMPSHMAREMVDLLRGCVDEIERLHGEGKRIEGWLTTYPANVQRFSQNYPRTKAAVRVEKVALTFLHTPPGEPQ